MLLHMFTPLECPVALRKVLGFIQSDDPPQMDLTAAAV